MKTRKSQALKRGVALGLTSPFELMLGGRRQLSRISISTIEDIWTDTGAHIQAACDHEGKLIERRTTQDSGGNKGVELFDAAH